MIRKSLRGIGLIALAVVVLLLMIFDRLWIPGNDQGKAVRVYYADNVSPAHQQIINRFNEQYRGKIEVVPVHLPFEKFSTNERKELFARSLRNKSDRLDIFAVDLIWVPRFSRWAEPLDSYIQLPTRGLILKQALESCIFESTLVALPIYIDVGLLYYRQDLVRQLPGGDSLERRLQSSITWDDFIRAGRSMRQKGHPYYIFTGNDYEGLVCTFFEMIAGQDEDFFKRSKLDFESPVAHTALQMLVDFVRTYGISPPEVSDFDEIRSYRYLLDRDGIFARGWPNFLESFRDSYVNKEKLAQVRGTLLPHFEGRNSVGVFGGWNLMVSKFSTRKREALEFIKFVQREDMQKLLFEVGGFFPTNVNVYADSAYVRQHPELEFSRTLIEHGFHRPAMVEYTKMSDIISRHVHLAIKGEITVDEALRTMSREIMTIKGSAE
jgi:multiple sugar transport system substrate-binding protein